MKLPPFTDLTGALLGLLVIALVATFLLNQGGLL